MTGAGCDDPRIGDGMRPLPDGALAGDDTGRLIPGAQAKLPRAGMALDPRISNRKCAVRRARAARDRA
jgi:hypothetical protein